MKVSENQLLVVSDFTRLLDSSAMKIERCRCPNCGCGINYFESHIDSAERKIFECYIKRFEQMLKSIDKSVFEVFGEDPRKILLANKIKTIQMQFQDDCLPKLQIVKKDYETHVEGVWEEMP